jgi:hypothetical protein
MDRSPRMSYRFCKRNALWPPICALSLGNSPEPLSIDFDQV